jgi:phage tail sheath protein FI
MSAVLVRPGVNVTLRSSPPARSAPTDTGVWFVAGTTDAGPVAPTFIQSMSDFTRIFGARVSYSVLYDAIDTYFREGGASAYIARVVGPGAVTASKNLLDASAGVSLIISALGPGASGNNTKIGVRAGQAGGSFVLFVQDVNNNEVETSPDLLTQAAAILWAQNSSYIRATIGASALNPAVVAASALAGGNDDRNNITDAQWQAALDSLTPDFGPGQVSSPGRTTDVGHQQLVDHAGKHRRVAILDAPDTPTVNTLLASATGARTGSQKFASMFWPWLIVPGVVTGTTRSVPPSALVAGLCSRNDSAGMGADQAAAGDAGVSIFASDLSQQPVSDTVRGQLNVGGIDVIREMFGGVRVYGWRSLVDPNAEPDWVNFGCARLYMSIAANAQNIAEGFLFDKIDGQGRTIAAFNGALSGLLQNYYNVGDLFGASASDAFFVDTGPQVNTPTTIANHELHAVLNVRMSEFAEMVQIEIYKKPITEA